MNLTLKNMLIALFIISQLGGVNISGFKIHILSLMNDFSI